MYSIYWMNFLMEGHCVLWELWAELSYVLTYCMKQSPSWEANRSSASQEIPNILWNPNVHYHIH